MPSAKRSASVHAQGATAYTALRERIVYCDLMPGAEVSQSDLAARLKAGVASVRFALTRLMQEGWVISMPRRGYVIRPLTMDDVNDVFRLRLILEPAAARIAAGNVATAELRRLDQVCTVGYEPGDGASERRFLAANRQFHVSLALASGSARLVRAIEQLHDEVTRMLRLGMWLRNETATWQHGHEEILAALASGDGARAEEIASRQLVYGQQLVLEVLSTSLLSSKANLANLVAGRAA